MLTTAKEQARTAFSGRAAEWQGWYEDTSRRTLESENLFARQRLALEMVADAVPAPARVLDLGCGTGDMSGRLMQRGYDVRGVDIAAPMVERARIRWGADRFQVGDTEHIPFDADTFEVVVCLGVIEYQDDDLRTLREIRRVLKPGGIAVISTPSAISPLYLADEAVHLLEALIGPIHAFVKYTLRGRTVPDGVEFPAVTIRRYRRGPWLRRLRAAGLEPDEWICHGWGWYRSRFGAAVRHLARGGKALGRVAARVAGEGVVRRTAGRFVRQPAVSWVATEQIVRATVPAGTCDACPPGPGAAR